MLASACDGRRRAEYLAEALLPDDWPWWCVPDFSDVKAEMMGDARWDDWVKRAKE